jgi:hypothetical protein
MLWVRADAELDRAVDGVWQKWTDGEDVRKNSSAAYASAVGSSCKGLGAQYWQTEAQGAWLYDAPWDGPRLRLVPLWDDCSELRSTAPSRPQGPDRAGALARSYLARRLQLGCVESSTPWACAA